MILKIKNKKLDFFNQVSLDLVYDSLGSAFAFQWYFDPNNKDHIDLGHVAHYHIVTIEHNEELLFTGFILSQVFTDQATKQLSGISGYSLPGVLEDCEIPTSIYPLQSDQLTLKEIAQKIIAPFKLKMIIDSSVESKMNKVYKVSTAGQTQNIKSYLTELASQRDINITHNEKGEILFTKAKTDQAPIAHFERGLATWISMSLTFDGQPMHSHITVQKQADVDGGNAGESTIRNPYVPFVFRSRVTSQNSGDDNDTAEAARNVLSQELKNIKLTINLDRWDIEGKVIRPNNIITVLNPEIFLFKKTNWFIESVNLRGDNESQTATLNCILPEVYSGKIPENIFEKWQS